MINYSRLHTHPLKSRYFRIGINTIHRCKSSNPASRTPQKVRIKDPWWAQSRNWYLWFHNSPFNTRLLRLICMSKIASSMQLRWSAEALVGLIILSRQPVKLWQIHRSITKWCLPCSSKKTFKTTIPGPLLPRKLFSTRSWKRRITTPRLLSKNNSRIRNQIIK